MVNAMGLGNFAKVERDQKQNGTVFCNCYKTMLKISGRLCGLKNTCYLYCNYGLIGLFSFTNASLVAPYSRSKYSSCGQVVQAV